MDSKIKMYAVFVFLLITSHGFSQTENNTTSVPLATVTFKNKNQNPLIKTVNELTNNDDFLTENTVKEINRIKKTGVVTIISDLEYVSLSEDKKLNSISLSEVQTIISNLKK